MASELDLIATVIRSTGEASPLRGRAFTISGRALIGRAPECDVRLEDTTVSRRHAWIESRDEKLFVDAVSTGSATFLNGSRIAPGATGEGATGEALLQIGGVLLRVSRLARTQPFEQALHTPGAMASIPSGAAPLLQLSRDGDECTVYCAGRYVEIPSASARVLWTLAASAGRIVHQWELQDAAGAEANLPQLVSLARRALRTSLDAGRLTRGVVESAIREAAISERHDALEDLSDEELMRKLILSRRKHGYMLCIPASRVELIEEG